MCVCVCKCFVYDFSCKQKLSKPQGDTHAANWPLPLLGCRGVRDLDVDNAIGSHTSMKTRLSSAYYCEATVYTVNTNNDNDMTWGHFVTDYCPTCWSLML